MCLKTCIISLATSEKRFPEGLARLQESVRRSGFTGEFLCWRPGSFPEGCPPHMEVPFAFKPYCFREAEKRGMDLVLWLDSSCVVLRKLDRIFQALTSDGHLLFRNHPHMVGQWASDEAIAAFGLRRDQAMAIPEINAAVIGLNLRHPVATAFLTQWFDAAEGEVAFRGARLPFRAEADYADMKWNRSGRASADPRVRGHRHDQTVAGILVHQLRMKLTSLGIQSYSPSHRALLPWTVIAIDRSVGGRDADWRSIGQIRRDRYIGVLSQGLAAVRTGWR